MNKKLMAKCIFVIASWIIIFLVCCKANAQILGQSLRYTINVRIAKPLPSFITSNLTAIQTSLNKIKLVSKKLNEGKGNEENTNYFTIDNNAVFLGVNASFAVPYPLPQGMLDEQATFENFLKKLSQFSMPDDIDNGYGKTINKHICNHEINKSCTDKVDF